MNIKLYIPLKLRYQLGRIDATIILRFALLLLALILSATQSISQAQTEPCTEPQDTPYRLSTDETLTRDIMRNQRHVYRLSLLPKQFARVVVDQKGIDVFVRFLDQNRQVLTERDSPNGKFGPESISVVAQATDDYYFEVCANKSQQTGSYQLKVDGPRASNANDEKRVNAERILMEARQSAGKRETLPLAIEQFTKALQIWQEIGDVREQGYAFYGIGEANRHLLNFPDAKNNFEQARLRLQEAQEPSGEANVLNLLGAAHRDLDDPRKALPYYADALVLRKKIGDRWGEALIHNNVGYLYSEMAEQQASIANSELALPLWREVKDAAMEANTLNNIAKANLDLGNLTAAFEQYQSILEFCKNNEPCNLEPYVRNSLGVIHDTWGEPTEALTEYYRALKLFHDRKIKREEAKALDNIGMVFAATGDPATALEQFKQALEIRVKELNHGGEEITQSNMGYALMLLGRNAEALQALEKAQYYSQKSVNQRFQAYTFMRLGAVHLASDKFEEALAAYNQALEIQKRIEDRRGQAITLDKIGELYSLMNQPAQALKNYQQALGLWSAVRDQQGEALSLYGIARVQRKQGNLLDARDSIVKGIEKVESMRTRMTSHRLRMSYLASKRDFYELEIDIRMSLYNTTRSRTELELALFASERAHARNLLDVLIESQADIRQGVDPELLDRERSQRTELTKKQSDLQALLNRKHTAEEKSTAEKAIQTLARSFDQTQAEIRKSSPHYAALTQPQPLRPAQVQQLLDANTLLLEYAIGEEHSYLWIVTPTDIKAFTLPGSARIDQAINNFRESVTALETSTSSKEKDLEQVKKLRLAHSNYEQRARELSNIVLKPAASLITKKRLLIVADGMLQYISFAALPVPRSLRSNSPQVPLITKHEIVYEPSASALAVIRKTPRPVASKTLAVFADPVFEKTDDRVRSAAGNSNVVPNTSELSPETQRALRDVGDIGGVDGPLRLDRLKYSRREADAIVAIVPPGSYIEAVDFDASRVNFLKQDLKQYSIVHVATHAILNGQNPELSGVVFSLVDEEGNSNDGFLRLSDIYNLNLPIDMVVLSACRTGVGKPVRGEGLIGLTRGFMHAGAARVVATLWKVDDEATAQLMSRFYSYLLEKKMPAAAALRQAQLDQMAIRPDPFFWAGFVLQGEWK